MGKLWRKRCEGTPCRDAAFFAPARAPAGDDPFFKLAPHGTAEVPGVQKQEAPPSTEEEKKDPLVEGLKTVGGKLAEHEPLKKALEPKLDQLKLTLWDHTSVAEKIALAGFMGANLGIDAAAFAASPSLRKTLSGVNIGKPLGLIPYSPIDGFKYQLPEAGKTATGMSADFTLNPYLAKLHEHRPGFPLSGATFGLDASLDARTAHFGITGGKFGLDFFGGGLKAEGKTFNELSPYPMLIPGRDPGDAASWLMQETPGMPTIKRPGYQFMVNADLMKMWPWLRKNF